MSHTFKPALKAAVLILAGSSVLAACGNARVQRGYIFDLDLANAIAAGVDNKQSVRDTLGTPTSRRVFDDSVWYYVSTQVRVRPIFWPDAKAHRVLAVSFGERDQVVSIENFGLEDMRDIRMVKDKTPTKGRELNFFQQLFQSVGQFGGAPGQGGPNPNQQGPGPTGPNG